MRITDLIVTPDQSRVVAIGVQWQASPNARATPAEHGGSPSVGNGGAQQTRDDKLVVYDFATKRVETLVISRLSHFDHGV